MKKINYIFGLLLLCIGVLLILSNFGVIEIVCSRRDTYYLRSLIFS